MAYKDIIEFVKAVSSVPLSGRILLLCLCLLLPLAWTKARLNPECRRVLLSAGSPAEGEPAQTGLIAAALCSPWRTALWEEAARQALDSGDLETAIRYLERANLEAVRIGLPDGEALSLPSLEDLAFAYTAIGDYPAALQTRQTIIARAGFTRVSAGELARLHLARGDFESARQVWQAFSEAEPDDAGARYQLGLLMATQDPESALPVLQEAARMDPALEEPVARLRQAIMSARLADDPAYSLLSVGRAFASGEEWGLAAEAFRQSILLRPDYAEAWAFLGEARQHIPPVQASVESASGASAGGLFELRTAAELDPTSLTAQTLLALYYLRQGDNEQAVQTMREAVELSPDNPVLRSQYADLQAASGDLYGAYETYQQAAALAPYDPAYTRQTIRFCLDYNFQVEQVALPLARRLTAATPGEALNLDLMGQVLVNLGDLASAERFLARALQADPTYAAAHLHLGLVHLLRGDAQAARRHLETALSLDPDGSTGSQARQLLGGEGP